MNNGSGMFVRCTNTGDHALTTYSCYTSHGTFQGETDVVGRGTLAQARLFPSWDAANHFIKNELPTWAREKFKPVEVTRHHLFLYASNHYAELIG